MALFLSTAAACVVPPPDSAWLTHGCRYDPASISPVSWRFFSVSSRAEAGYIDAQGAWNAVGAPGFCREESSSPDPEINVLDDHLNDTNTIARTLWSCSNGYYEGNETTVQYNTEVVGVKTLPELNVAGQHELGHVYGPAHVQGCRLMTATLEEISRCGIMRPTADDVNGVRKVYP
jgi:hypothetical protein